MRAYFVYDEAKETDTIIVPEIDIMLPVNRQAMDLFISVRPDFGRWDGRPANGIAPEALGQIIATRDDDGDVCVVERKLWKKRLTELMG